MPRTKTEDAADKTLLLRLSEAQLEGIRVRAKKERRSLNAQLLMWIDECLEKTQETSHHECVGSRDH